MMLTVSNVVGRQSHYPDTVAEISLTPPPGRTYHPSPVDWRDEIIYSILIDRFQDDPGAVVVGDPAGGNSRHGGTLRGVTSRLDYLVGLGVTTLTLSPVAENPPRTYHGYAPVHLLAVDPYLGDLADLVELVTTAHELGLRVVLDLLVNHAGPVFEYVDGDGWRGMAGQSGEIGRWRLVLRPAELAHPEHFSRRGVINNWKDPDQAAYGDFPPNYRRFATDNPATRNLLTRIACWWLKETDVDGFRIDALRHIDPDFVIALIADIKAYAAGLGKHNLLTLGEYSTSDDRYLVDSYALGLDSVYAYAEYRRQNRALHGRAPASQLARSFEISAKALGPAVADTVRFIDNQDVYRFLRAGEPESVLRMAMAFLMFSIGIPSVYYGSEQAFRQFTDNLEHEGSHNPADPQNREDMFADGRFVSDSSAGDRFDPTSSMYRWTARLAAIRLRHPVLRRGGQLVRFADPTGPGLYAFSRFDDTDEILVVLNTDTVAHTENVPVGADLARGPVTDELDPAYPVVVDESGSDGAKVRLSLPGHGVRVLVPSHRR
jgi:glycosidase